MDDRDALNTTDKTALSFRHAGKLGLEYSLLALGKRLTDATYMVTIDPSGHINTNSSLESIGMRALVRCNAIVPTDEWPCGVSR